ncbi:MAG: 16S rRNA (guanine(527)-N(7))-methyltransferase RsmG [Bacteroidales bacterium]|nr:16S rRNA (guanine(527)-N(7))-methyltransferase RsmG [Bacteroidales bacterium]
MTEKYFPSLTEEQRRQFSMLPSLYREWNERINVISRKDIENFEVNHLLHSLSIARFISFLPGTTVIDIGTGGGLPGIPLAILFPEVRFTLIDSIAKKIRVVSEITAAAGIGNVLALPVRSEKTNGTYDFIISRAVTEVEQFVKLTRHLSSPLSFNNKKNGWIFLKGGDLERELRPFHSSAAVVPISNWFDEPYFETKKIVYLPR